MHISIATKYIKDYPVISSLLLINLILSAHFFIPCVFVNEVCAILNCSVTTSLHEIVEEIAFMDTLGVAASASNECEKSFFFPYNSFWRAFVSVHGLRGFLGLSHEIVQSIFLTAEFAAFWSASCLFGSRPRLLHNISSSISTISSYVPDHDHDGIFFPLKVISGSVLLDFNASYA